MYKKLRYGLIALLAFVGLTASAQGVTFDFDNDYATLFPGMGLSSNSSNAGDITESVTTTAISGYTITVSAKEEGAKTPNRLWDGKSNRLRMYSGTLTIKGSGIQSVEFTWGTNNITTQTGELKGNVWTGNANTVVFNVLSNTQISKIVINSNVAPPDVTEEDLNHGTENNPLSVSEAIEAAEVVGNAKSKEDFYVTGTISRIEVDKNNNNTPYTYSRKLDDGNYANNATYFISDGKGNEFEVYRGKYFSGKSWEEGLADIKVGDDVVVCGKIILFNGTDGPVPEFASGDSHLVLLNGKGYEEPAPVEPTVYAVTVEDALEAASELDKNKTSFDLYKVTGYVVGTPVYKRSSATGELFGDVNLYIADEINGNPTLYIYQAKNKDNELFTESDLNQFTAGDKVTFIGNLKNYVKKDKETGVEADPLYELVDGYLLNYEISPTVTITIPSSGHATFCPARPIMVDDQEVYVAKEIQEDKVVVERVSGAIAAKVGLIVKGEGSVTFDVEKSGEEPENLLVGVLDPTELEENEAYILVDGAFHPCNAGTFPAGKAYLPASAASGAKIIIFGDETTAINEVKTQNESSEIYTIGGIRVKNAQQKGVYIINGKKVVK